MRNITIPCLKPSSGPGAHKAEESKCLSGPQLQENPGSYTMKRTLVESRNEVHGFEGVGTRDTLETASSEETSIMPTVSRTETHPRESVTNNGIAERRVRRTPASVGRYLADEEDGNTLLRLSKLPNPSPPYEQLFNDLDSLGLAPQERSPGEGYKGGQPSGRTPQHRNIEQSLDEILYLPSCG